MYRLTIVKAWNNEEIESYADLVKLGTPDFIEVKGKNFMVIFENFALSQVAAPETPIDKWATKRKGFRKLPSSEPLLETDPRLEIPF